MAKNHHFLSLLEPEAAAGLEYGARYLMGENLKVVWAEFSTLS